MIKLNNKKSSITYYISNYYVIGDFYEEKSEINFYHYNVKYTIN